MSDYFLFENDGPLQYSGLLKLESFLFFYQPALH